MQSGFGSSGGFAYASGCLISIHTVMQAQTSTSTHTHTCLPNSPEVQRNVILPRYKQTLMRTILVTSITGMYHKHLSAEVFFFLSSIAGTSVYI